MVVQAEATPLLAAAGGDVFVVEDPAGNPELFSLAEPFVAASEAAPLTAALVAEVTVKETAGAATLFRFAAPGETGQRTNQVLLTLPRGENSPQETGGDKAPLPDQARLSPEGTLVPAPPRHRDSLLAQLQQIISNSSETGQVRISVSRQAADNVDAAFGRFPPGQGLATLLPPEQPGGPASDKPGQQLAGLRLNLHQQYYEARLAQQQPPGGDSNEQQQQPPGGEAGRQAAATLSAAATASPAAGDPGGPFNQLLAAGGMAPQPLQPTGEQARAMPLIPGTIDHDQEVLRQVLERFHLARGPRGPLDTRINIRLHPAELGALRIDLTVSEGSIRANVVAQSQQVQEIIERNLARLKSLLEGQGFTVDRLVVTTESETVADFNFFDNRPFQQQTAATPPGKAAQAAAGMVGFDQLVAASGEQAGVNVKI
jgi:hypothetical protein